MTYKEVKDLLKSLRSKKSRLKALQLYISEQRALIDGVSGINYENLRVVSSFQNGKEDSYIKHLDRIADLIKRYNNLFNDMCKEEDMLANMMNKLTPTEYEVILNRFYRGISVRKTAMVMNYEESTIKSITQRAIKRMAS